MSKKENLFKNKTFRVRLITSIFILLFYCVYFSIIAVPTSSFVPLNVQNIFIYIFHFINIILLVLMNYEIIKLFQLNHKRFWMIQTISYITVILLYLIPFTWELTYPYVPYTNFKISWLHSWVLILVYLFFYFLYILINVIHNKMTTMKITQLFLFNALIVVGIKSISILMLSSKYGWTSFLYVLLIVILTDVFAYLGGWKFGKNKIAPTISPNKTWEGAIVGTVMGTLIPLIVVTPFIFSNNLLSSDIPFAQCLVSPNSIVVFFIYFFFSLILSIFAQLGDLLFSYIKRKFAVKDFSNLLPGHGGILDRVDSLLIVSIIAFLFTRLIYLITT